MSVNILFNKSALQIVLKKLTEINKYEYSHLEGINNDRYFVAYGKPNIAVLFKRDFLQSYGQMGFINDNGQKETGLGETVNVEHLIQFNKREVEILYFTYPDGRIYYISLIDLLQNSHRWKNKEGKEVRSFSIHHFKNVESKLV